MIFWVKSCDIQKRNLLSINWSGNLNSDTELNNSALK